MAGCVTGCGRPADEFFLCMGCWGEVERDLGDVAALAEELETTITRQAKTTSGVGVTSRSAETPLMFHQAASEVQDDLRSVLVAWVRDLWETNGADQLDAEDTLEGLSRWLLRHPTWIRTHPAGEELHDEITDAIKRCWQVIDRAPDRVYLGTCTAVYEGVHCTEELYGHHDRQTARCRTCGTEWDMTFRREWLLDQIADRHLTAAEMSQALPSWLDQPLTPAQIRGWAHRGRIRQCGQRAVGPRKAVPLYRVGDVLGVLLQVDSRVA